MEEQKIPLDVQAAMFLKQAVPQRRLLLQEASAAVLRKVSFALDIHPFNESPFKANMGNDGILYQMGLQIANAKFILFQNSLKEKTFEVIAKNLKDLNISDDNVNNVIKNLKAEFDKASAGETTAQ